MITLLGALMWACLTARIAATFTTLNPIGIAYRNTLDDCNDLARMHNLPSSMRRHMREFLQASSHLMRTKHHSHLLSILTPTLRSEVAWRCHRRWICSVWFLQKAEHRATHGALPHRAPSTRCTADLVHRVWHRRSMTSCCSSR